jgi:competence protein ComGC
MPVHSPNAFRPLLTDRSGRTVLETVLVLLFISIFLVVAIDRFTSSVRSIRENALVVEIGNLRRSVNFYAVINKKLPASLKTLLTEKAMVAREDIRGEEYDVVIVGSFIESMTVDPDGEPLDPFGNRYVYDPATGRVNSSTPGYGSW